MQIKITATLEKKKLDYWKNTIDTIFHFWTYLTRSVCVGVPYQCIHIIIPCLLPASQFSTNFSKTHIPVDCGRKMQLILASIPELYKTHLQSSEMNWTSCVTYHMLWNSMWEVRGVAGFHKRTLYYCFSPCSYMCYAVEVVMYFCTLELQGH